MKNIKRNINKFEFVKLQIGIICLSFGPLISNYASRFNFQDYRFKISILTILTLLVFYFYIWQFILRKLPLSIAYSYRCTLLIWSLLWSYLFAGQVINLNNLIGTLFIFVGIYLISNE